ncbi:MAG: hypothetical protein ACFFEY_03650 [Candidatus Thorarchaeota archaeon]
MDTKRKSLLLLVIVVISILMIYVSSFNEVNDNKPTKNIDFKLSSSGDILIDKVYNFTESNPQLDFLNNLFFEKNYYYDIIIGVVTPNKCDIDITLWDPEGDQFFISSEKNITQFDYRTIPFGTALEGNYSARFEAIFSQNLNIHIRIEKKDKCLLDKIEFNEREDIMYYDVAKFYHGMTIEFALYFETDMYYKFLFERVSTISITLSNFVTMDHIVLDPQDISFQIYQNKSLGYANYYLGTAIGGLYNVNITILCDVQCVNIAYAVLEKEDISEIVDPNNPDPPIYNPPINNTGDGIEAFIPFEGTLTILVFVGVAVFVPVIIIINRRKRNNPSI